MNRSIDEFVRRQKEEREQARQRKQFTITPMGSARGLDAFYDTLHGYYQEEADEEMSDGSNDDTEENADDINLDNTFSAEDDTMGEDTDNKAPVETDGINGTLPEDENSSMPEDDNSDESNDSDMDMNDDPMKTFGQHGGDDLPNNQYDPAEIAKVMEFVADEAKALSDYMEAAKTTKTDILQRLYSDIADEERYHLEQLLFAKAEITGEEYKPRDPDIRKEYEELLSMGMDEGSAMATAVDKFNLRAVSISKTPDGNVEIENKEIQEAFEEMERGLLYIETVQFVLEYCTDDYITDKVLEMNLPKFIQEDFSVAASGTYSAKLNGFSVIGGAFVGIIKLIRKVGQIIRTLVEKSKHRIYGLYEFVKRHGIQGLFQNGVMLYLWNDRTSTMDVPNLCATINETLYLAQEIVRVSNLRGGQYTNEIAHTSAFFKLNNVQKSSPLKCYKDLQTIDPKKTKVIVTPQNAAGVAEIFFGSYDADLKQMQALGNGIASSIASVVQTSQGIDLSHFRNYFVILDLITQVLDYVTELMKNFAGELTGLENDPSSIYRTNIKVYNNCQEYMQVIVKSLASFSKIVSSDTSTLNQLTQVIQNS